MMAKEPKTFPEVHYMQMRLQEMDPEKRLGFLVYMYRVTHYQPAMNKTDFGRLLGGITAQEITKLERGELIGRLNKLNYEDFRRIMSGFPANYFPLLQVSHHEYVKALDAQHAVDLTHLDTSNKAFPADKAYSAQLKELLDLASAIARDETYLAVGQSDSGILKELGLRSEQLGQSLNEMRSEFDKRRSGVLEIGMETREALAKRINLARAEGIATATADIKEILVELMRDTTKVDPLRGLIIPQGTPPATPIAPGVSSIAPPAGATVTPLPTPQGGRVPGQPLLPGETAPKLPPRGR